MGERGCQQKKFDGRLSTTRPRSSRNSHIAENGLLTVTFDVNTHHHKLAARKIMAALYCWRVRTHMYNSLDIVFLIKPVPNFFFRLAQSWGHVWCPRHKPL